MTDKEKADCILELQKQKSDHFKQTRDIEFKVNISIWTLIVLIGYFGKIQLLLYVYIALAIFVIHLIWMVLIQNSEDSDHHYMNTCREVIEKKVKLQIKERELTGIEKCFKDIAKKLEIYEIRWIFLEVMMTVVLLVGVGFLIFFNNAVVIPQYSIRNEVLNFGDSGIKFEELLTIYGFYLVFVTFSFETINNKRRSAQNNFRAWCKSRKERIRIDPLTKEEISELSDLGINWEVEAWLEKDLIFHLLDFKIRIKEARERNVANKNLPMDDLKINSEQACNDYYGYIYECLRFKNMYKNWVIVLLISLVVAGTLNILNSDWFKLAAYLIISTMAFIILKMLRGPNFDFINHPLINSLNRLSPEDRIAVKRLEDLIREV